MIGNGDSLDWEEIIQEVISRAEEEFAPIMQDQRQLPRTLLLDIAQQGQFKVRLYPSEEIAEVQERLVVRVMNDVPIPMFVGREGPYLIFRYLPLDEVMEDDPIAAATGIGLILHNLSNYRPHVKEIIDVDSEFKSWLDTLFSLGYLTRRVMTLVWRRYQAEVPLEPILCLDHWDAMFHNFGLYQGRVCLLDEKHLRFSFAGVGLVKPSLLMELDQFTALLDAYGQNEPLEFYKTNRPFLRLYYLVAALYFYAQKQLDGDSQMPANSRLRYYRGNLVRMIWRSPLRRIQEGIIFSLRYPGASVSALLRRLSGPLSFEKLFRRVWLDVKPWNDDAF